MHTPEDEGNTTLINAVPFSKDLHIYMAAKYRVANGSILEPDVTLKRTIQVLNK